MEFPRAVYQGLTVYLLIAIGWHGGEELSILSGPVLTQAVGFLLVGFLTNLVIGILAYWILRTFIPQMRQVDSATVAAYYGSDSAGTFVTCVGMLQVAHIAYAALYASNARGYGSPWLSGWTLFGFATEKGRHG